VFLEVSNLQLFTPDKSRHLLKNFNFTLANGNIAWIHGDNGCGKSTLLKALIGEGHFYGKIDWSVSLNDIFYIPQSYSHETHLPISLGEILSLKKPALTSTESSYTSLNANQLSQSWNKSSGGERQRALLEYAFMHEPKILLLDEPTNHLDKNSRTQIITSLENYILAKPNERAAILVSHDSLPFSKKCPITLINLGGKL